MGLTLAYATPSSGCSKSPFKIWRDICAPQSIENQVRCREKVPTCPNTAFADQFTNTNFEGIFWHVFTLWIVGENKPPGLALKRPSKSAQTDRFGGREREREAESTQNKLNTKAPDLREMELWERKFCSELQRTYPLEDS